MKKLAFLAALLVFHFNSTSAQKLVEVPTAGSDASISSVGSAQQRQPCGEAFPVRLAVQNAGTVPLLSALVSWEVNGKPQPDFVWSGSLLVGTTDTALVAMLPFLPDTVYQINFLVKEANGQPDPNPSSNPASLQVFSDLSGGDLTVGYNGRFQTIPELSDRLSASGLCGSARIVLLPGEHTGTLVLTQNLGLSASKTIEITSEGGDRECALWSGADIFFTTPTLILQSTSHVWVHELRIIGTVQSALKVADCSDLLFENTDFTGGSGGRAVEVGQTGSTAFRNCSFRASGLVAGFDISNQITVENCLVEQSSSVGWQALRFQVAADCRIAGCTVKGPTSMWQCRRMEVSGNEFQSLVPPNGTPLEVLKAFESDSLWISNNFFVGNNLGNFLVVNLNPAKSVDFVHNSLLRRGGGAGATLGIASVIGQPFAGGVRVFNNIIVNDNPLGYAMGVPTAYAALASNHNCFHATNQDKVLIDGFLTPMTLADWQAQSGNDASSIVFLPPFLADTNLHILENPAELAGKALFIPNFSEKDLDGDPRPAALPDIGADQFAGLSTDARLVFMPQSNCHGLPDFVAKLKNDGPDTLRRADLHWSANDHPQPTFFWKGALPPGQETNWLPLGDYTESPGHDGYKIDALAVVARDPDSLDNRFSSPAFFTKMGGDYTVGGTFADFHALDDATKMLKNVGQCANVRLLLRPGINVSTQYFVEATNQPDSLLTIVEPEAPGLLDGMLSQLNIEQKKSWMVLRRLVVRQAYMTGEPHDIVWENCAFKFGIGTYGTMRNLKFDHCDFREGTASIDHPGPSPTDENIRFLNCDFGTSAGEPGDLNAGTSSPGNLYIYGASGLTVRNCRFERTARLKISSSVGKLRVEGNSFASSPAIWMEGCNYLPTDTAQLTNNFCHFRGHSPGCSGCTNVANLIFANGCPNLNVWHNTLFFEPTNPVSDHPVAFYKSNVYVAHFENNLVKTNDNAAAFSWGINQPGDRCDHNHFEVGALGIYSGQTLAQWNGWSGFDAKSTTGAIKFEAENDPSGLSADLHLATDSPLIPLTTNVLSEIKTDFDGQTRGPTSTAIGADEPGGLPLAGPVWPGDCDHDKEVTALDWLHLGLAIGQGKTGAARADQSIGWSPKFAADWADSIQQVNSKHSDCNGDGAATAADTLAISQNFGQAHFALGQTVRTGVPLFVDLPAGPYSAGQKIVAPLRLGSAAESFYGAAFEIDFSPNSIKPGSFWADFSQNWLGADAIGFFEKDNSTQIQLALTKTNGQDAAGFGQIGTLHFEVGQLADSLKIRATGLRGFLADGSQKAIAAAEPPAVGVVVSTKNGGNGPVFELWPNPTTGVLFLITKGESGGMAEVFDGLGRLVFSQKTGSGTARLELGGLPGGIYQIRVTGEHGAAVRQVLVVK